jgi:predicted RNA polymerase sigma factor
MTTIDPDRAGTTAAAVARRSYGKLVAYLAARTGDVAAAEDALSEAFASALANWPKRGCPANPEAWLLTVARRKLIDAVRTSHADPIATEELDRMIGAAPAESAIPDERLAMIFTCAHPAIDASVRAPLILQVVLGLNAEAIAGAFLTSPAAMSKRLVRAKIKIREAAIPFRVPDRSELPARLETALDAVYAAYTEGWTDPVATDASRRDLAEEALFLSRLLVELLPREPEALGLLALLLHTEARRPARRKTVKWNETLDEHEEYVPLAEQNPDLWDANLVLEAESLIRRAGSFAMPGRYQLQAALQSAHVYRIRTGHANWAEVVALYDTLCAFTGSPVVAINRAVALAEVRGPATALQALDQLASDARLADYQPYWAARADLLARTGAHTEAHRAYEIAIGLERDSAVCRFLRRRQSALPR